MQKPNNSGLQFNPFPNSMSHYPGAPVPTNERDGSFNGYRIEKFQYQKNFKNKVPGCVNAIVGFLPLKEWACARRSFGPIFCWLRLASLPAGDPGWVRGLYLPLRHQR
jgi:hypothetical protein